MLPNQKSKATAALKRLDGLSKKVQKMIEEDENCPEVLRNILAMKGHLDHIQGQVLDSHLHTCALKNLSKGGKMQDDFINELLKVIGLSTR